MFFGTVQRVHLRTHATREMPPPANSSTSSKYETCRSVEPGHWQVRTTDLAADMQNRILLLRVVDVADKATHLEPAAAQAHQICVDGSHALDWSAPYTVGRTPQGLQLNSTSTLAVCFRSGPLIHSNLKVWARRFWLSVNVER